MAADSTFSAGLLLILIVPAVTATMLPVPAVSLPPLKLKVPVT